MRLTLRTLLAWLDDTLPPAEVRQIGQQVTESPLAQELVEKIHRVTRQRRLIVPEDSGPEGTDPNRVAAYLDNELAPEQVAEYEKLCLTSDLNLAEVASAHQILSLLAQKAKVPLQARHRMYHLVRGREAGPKPSRRPAPVVNVEPAMVPIWTPPEPKRRSMLERFGPLAAVAGLIAVLCWSAWMSATSTPKQATPSLIARADPEIPPAPPLAINRKPAIDANAVPVDAAKSALDQEVGANVPPVEPDPETAAKPVELQAMPKAPEMPRDASAVLGDSDGVTLRNNPETRAWDRLASGAVLRAGDRIANLAPYHTPVQIGSFRATMVGDSEIKVLAEADGMARLELLRGRVKLESLAASPSVVLMFAGASLTVSVPQGTFVGVERVAAVRDDAASPLVPRMRITAVQGDVSLQLGATSETLAAGSSMILTIPDTLTPEPGQEPPVWLTESGPSVAEQASGKTFAAYFRPERSALLCLVEAAEDEDAQIRRLAVTALGAIGPLDLVVGTMSRKGDPASRQAAIAVLRRAHLHDDATSKALHEMLVQAGGSQEWAGKVEEMLAGYTTRQADDEATGARLVNFLKETEDVGIRELAIMNLVMISGRGDRLRVTHPDKPAEGNGLKAWQDLVQRRELRLRSEPSDSKK